MDKTTKALFLGAIGGLAFVIIGFILADIGTIQPQHIILGGLFVMMFALMPAMIIQGLEFMKGLNKVC